MAEYAGLEVVAATEMVRLFSAPQFILGQFFPEEPVNSRTAQWDVQKLPRTVPPAVAANAGATQRKPLTLDKVSFTMPRTRLMDIASGDDMKFARLPGSENERYSQALVRDKLLALTQECEYAREFARASALTGTWTVTYEGPLAPTVSVSYGFSATHIATAAVSWATASTAIAEDIRAWKKLISQDAGLRAWAMILTSETYIRLVNNTVIQNYLKEPGNNETVLREGRITRLFGLDIFQYDEGYVNSSAVWTNFIGTDKVIILARPTDAGMRGMAGQAADVDAPDSPGRFSKTWVQNDPSGIACVVEDNYAPKIPVPDAIVYADVIP